jgi:predicted MFS family arabinose efflux permease
VLLIILSLGGFAASMAARIVDPLVTAIAVDFIMPVAMVALLASAYTLPFSFSQPLLGPIGDAIGKSLMIRIALAMLAVFLLASAFAPSFSTLFGARILAGMAGAGIIPLSFALIGDTFAIAVRQVAMSRFLASTLVGQLVGSSAAGLLAEWIGWRWVLGLSAIIACLAAIAAILWLPRSNQPSNPIDIREILHRYRRVLQNPRAYICFCSVFLEGGAIYGVTPFIGDIMQQRQIGGLREAGFAVAGLGLGGLLYTLVVPLILKVATRMQMMRAGGILAGLSLMALAIPLNAWGVSGVMVFLGIGFFLMHNSIQTEVTELLPSARASCFALHAFSFYLGQSVGPILYGQSLSHFGLQPSVLTGGIVLICVGFGINFFLNRYPVLTPQSS